MSKRIMCLYHFVVSTQGFCIRITVTYGVLSIPINCNSYMLCRNRKMPTNPDLVRSQGVFAQPGRRSRER